MFRLLGIFFHPRCSEHKEEPRVTKPFEPNLGTSDYRRQFRQRRFASMPIYPVSYTFLFKRVPVIYLRPLLIVRAFYFPHLTMGPPRNLLSPGSRPSRNPMTPNSRPRRRSSNNQQQTRDTSGRISKNVSFPSRRGRLSHLEPDGPSPSFGPSYLPSPRSAVY